ncbi:MAG: hypothetical protein AAF296_03670 [Pseudomonadota bacterium]
MRLFILSVLALSISLPVIAQSAEETEKAIDCLALTELANANRSVPDTAQIRRWQSTVATSPHCKQADQGVDYRLEQYRTELKQADPTRRLALELMIESEAEKCVSGAKRSSYESGI